MELTTKKRLPLPSAWSRFARSQLSMLIMVGSSITWTYQPHFSTVDLWLFQRLVGELNYLLKSRWDVGFAVSVVSRYMHRPQQVHLQATLDFLWYLLPHPSIWKEKELLLSGYSDADYAGNPNDHTSTGAFIFLCGSSPISWCS